VDVPSGFAGAVEGAVTVVRGGTLVESSSTTGNLRAAAIDFVFEGDAGT
jgi:hypothetical protein